MAGFYMLNGIMQKLKDALTGLFAFIPQMMYFVYTCTASVLDFFQFIIRKLAGLDVYYVDGVAVEGDLILEILKGILGIENTSNNAYSTLSTVFWSLIIFAVITLVLSTIIKLIISHYNYNSEKSNPMTIIRGSIKSILTMALIPIVTIFGIQISNALLKTLDQISAGSSSVTIATVYENSAKDYKNVFKDGKDSWGNSTYSSYDFFGFGSYTNQTGISGQLFLVSANKCNRVRSGSYTARQNGTGDQWSDVGIFTSKQSDADERKEEVAFMIDYAFANHLTLQERTTASVLKGETFPLLTSYAFLQSAVWYLGTIQYKSFSKFNVGLVWYYYNLWGFNYFVAFAGLSITLTLLINIVFGLITRIINVLALFLVYPMMVGISPLDEGKAQGSWKTEFVSNILMTYGAIVGMNLVFMILPMLQNISFFNSTVPDLIFNMIIMIAALVSTKKIIEVFSQIIGSKDANAEGASTKEESKKIAFAAADKAVKTARVAVKAVATVYSGGAAVALEVAKKMAIEKAKKEIAKKIQEKINLKKKEDAKKEQEEQKKEVEQEIKEGQQAEEDGQNTDTNAEDQQQGAGGENSEQNSGGDIQNQNVTANGGTATENTEGETDNKDKKEEENDSEEKTEDKQSDDKDEPDDGFNEDGYKDDELDALAEQSQDVVDNLDSKDFDSSKYGKDAAAAQDAKAWYDRQIQRLQKEKGSPLTEEEKNEVKENARDRFVKNSSSADNMARQKVDYKRKQKRTARKEKSSKRGAKIKNFIDNSTIIPLAAESLKVVGKFSGISDLGKGLTESGVTDSFIGLMQDFGQVLKTDTSKLPKTKKQKEDAKKEKKKKEALNLGKVTSYKQATLKQIQEMINAAEKIEKESDGK